MPTENNVKKMLGDKGYKVHALKDSDGDGVKNIFDCEPYNPKKQGIFHRITGAALEKTGFSKTAKRVRERGEFVDKVRIEERATAQAEERSQRLETAQFRETQKGERRRKFIKGGGSVGAFSRSLSSVGKAIPAAPKVTTRRKGKKKGKKGKKGKRRTASQPKTMKPFDLSDVPRIDSGRVF